MINNIKPTIYPFEAVSKADSDIIFSVFKDENLKYDSEVSLQNKERFFIIDIFDDLNSEDEAMEASAQHLSNTLQKQLKDYSVESFNFAIHKLVLPELRHAKQITILYNLK